MLYTDKSYEYSKVYLSIHSVGIIFSLGMIVLGFYVLFTEDFFSGGWSMILGIPLFALLLIGLIFEKQNANTILVNNQEIIALRRKGRVIIPWSSIEHIYYSASQGLGAPEPIYSLYIFSKTNDFIIIREQIKGFPDFVEVLKQHWPKGELEYIPFLHLVGLFLRVNFRKGRAKKR